MVLLFFGLNSFVTKDLKIIPCDVGNYSGYHTETLTQFMSSPDSRGFRQRQQGIGQGQRNLTHVDTQCVYTTETFSTKKENPLAEPENESGNFPLV